MTRPTALATWLLAVMVSLAGCSSAKVEIDAAVDKLQSRQCDGSLPLCLTPEGEVVNWESAGNGPTQPCRCGRNHRPGPGRLLRNAPIGGLCAGGTDKRRWPNPGPED